MGNNDKVREIKDAIVSYPDFPRKGVIFRDFLPILQNPRIFDDMLSLFHEIIKEKVPDVEVIVGIESRGFLIGAPLALKLNLPFVPIRKAGKLPGKVEQMSFSLEYGKDVLEIQQDVIRKDQKVVVVDDLIATGGSLKAGIQLLKKCEADVQCCLLVIELTQLNGRNGLEIPTHSLVQF